MKKKVLFVVDWRDSSPDQINKLFDNDEFCDYEWHIYNSVFKQQIGPSIVNRYLENIIAVLYILKKKHQYDHIVIWQQMIGFMLCLFPRFRKNPKIIITTVLYSPSKDKKSFIRLYLLKKAVKKADSLLYYSEDMANDVKKNFPNYAHKIHSTYIPIIKETIASDQLPITNYELNPRTTVFSGGRSDRDFDSIVTAFRNTDIPVVIVCSKNYTFKNSNSITKNIRIFNDLSPSEFYALASASFCTVISLKNEFSSCGQLLFSFCMENGKPILASDSYGTRDYITNLVNGLLFPIADPEAILNAYNLLIEDKNLRNKLIENSKKFAKNMTFNNYIKTISEIISNYN